MTDHEEPDPTPAQQAVSQLGDDIKAAIAEIAEATPTIAKTAAAAAVVDEASKRAVRWLFVAWVSAVIAAAGTAWLTWSYLQSKQSNVQFEVRYEGTTAVCARGPDSPDGRPSVVCHRTSLGAGHGVLRWPPPSERPVTL